MFVVEDEKWRAELAAHPETLRGDALDHRMVESKLMTYLTREDYPLTQVKEKFIANFLEAYSVQRNSGLKGSTTNQISDLLLSNTLPTLLYFLDLLTKVLIKLFPELDAHRNSNTMESIRQSSMECIFPSIFPTLMALYKKKYVYRDLELYSKMTILASVGAGGCNITLDDLGVSKWFCLDDKLVLAERAKGIEKRRSKERMKRSLLGESEEEARQREAEEDRQMALEEEQRWKEIRARRKQEPKGANSNNPQSTNPATIPPQSTSSSDHAAQSSPTTSIIHHPISSLTNADDTVRLTPIAPDDGDTSSQSQFTTPPRTSPSRHTSPLIQLDGANLTSNANISPASGTHSTDTNLGIPRSLPSNVPRLRSSNPSHSPSRNPQTRLEAVADFEAGSLSRSPRAEKIQDLLSRSPSRRVIPNNAPTSTATASDKTNGPIGMPSSSPSSSLATSHTTRADTLQHPQDGAAVSTSSARKPRSLSSALNESASTADTTTPTNTGDVSSNMITPLQPTVPSHTPNDTRKQVGFSTSTDSSTIPAPTPFTTPQQPAMGGGLAAALKQARTPNGVIASPPSLRTSEHKPSNLGFGGSKTLDTISHLTRDSDDEDEDFPRMPLLDGPVLGSSMPMLQGLPSSLLTHTPGSGSELLKRELQEKKEKKHRAQAASMDITPVTPAVSASTPGGVSQTAVPTPIEDEDEEETFPFQEAVVLLRRLSQEHTPRDKLQCLIAVASEVCWCVDRFYSRDIFIAKNFRPKQEELCINADDLLSIVSFILIKSQLTNVISEAAFIDDFISRSMKLHMPGYFLATLQASIELITKLDKQKFLSRESIEQELRDTNGTNHSNGTPGPVTQRRPSYLDTHSSTNSPSPTTSNGSALPHPTSKPVDVTLPNGANSSARAANVRPSHPLTLPTNGHHRSNTQPSSRAQPSVHQQQTQLAATSTSTSSNTSNNYSNFTPDSQHGTPLHSSVDTHPNGVTITHSVNTRSLSFHSSPGSRVDSAEEEAATGSSWSQPFELKLEHFTPPPKQTPVRKLAQMGLTRLV